MKVLIVAPADSLHTVRWIERLQNVGVDCVLFDMTLLEKQQQLNIENIYRAQSSAFTKRLNNIFLKIGIIGRFPAKFVIALDEYSTLKKVISKHQIDLVNIHWLYHSAALSATFLRGIPKVVTPWGSDLLVPAYEGPGNNFKKIFHKILVRRVVSSADAACCDAPHMKSALIQFGAKAESVDLIYFGTDMNVFSPLKRSSAFREKLHVKEEDCMILSNRQLARVYDISTLFNALVGIQSTNQELKVVIAGSGPDESRLRDQVDELNLQKIVSFTGRLSDEEFAIATSSADIYVSTSPTDGGIAASVAEAMACSVPVIISNFGDNPHWLKNETAGLLFDAGNSNQLAEQIALLANNQPVRKAMGKVGRDVILEDNNSELETQKIVQLYTQVLALHRMT